METKMKTLDPQEYAEKSSSEAPVHPIRIEHQAKLLSLATEHKRHELITSLNHGYDYPITVGLALPIMWASPSNINQENNDPLPYSPNAVWSDIEEKLFLLGLYAFGKNLRLLSKFLGTKTVGNVLSYYYGNFYKTDAYKTWADCRKEKSKTCILGKRIFEGSRLRELVSRLKSRIPEQDHDSLIKVYKSFSDKETSFEEFVFTLKSNVGAEAFVEAVRIGKGEKHDLTRFLGNQSKPNIPDLLSGKDYSSLASEEIIKLLTRGSRRSKIKSKDIFWEAVWPRLLARGWNSEQPNDVRATKKCLVFLVPGIKTFSRSELTKGTHYFDSVDDVLKKVAADPVILELEADRTESGFPAEKKGPITDVKLNRGSQSDVSQEFPKFTIIDTSMVEGEEPFKVRELRNLPLDANINLDKARESMHMTSSDNCGGMKANEVEETDRRHANPQPEPANPRRHGTRNRPPTAKALEAIAYGLVRSGKRKDDLKNTVTNQLYKRAREAPRDSGYMAASGDAEQSM